MPERIQRKRSKGWKMPPNTVYVGRPTKYGNPFREGDFNDVGEKISKLRAVQNYRYYLKRKYPFGQLAEFLAPLRGKDLACWCPLDCACHADVLIELANK